MPEHHRYDDTPENRITKDYLREILDLKLEPIVKLQAEHHRTLFGDGSDGYQGLRVEVDRIKQSAKTWRAIGAAVGLPILADLGMRIWHGIKSLGGQ